MEAKLFLMWLIKWGKIVWTKLSLAELLLKLALSINQCWV